jgi:hypothetical protein
MNAWFIAYLERNREVNQIHVQISEAQIGQCAPHCRQDVFLCVVCVPQLGRDEEILSLTDSYNARDKKNLNLHKPASIAALIPSPTCILKIARAFTTNLLLITIVAGAVNMTVAHGDSILNNLCDNIFPNFPCPEPDEGHDLSRSQSNSGGSHIEIESK